MHIYKEQEAEPSTGLMMPEPAPAASPGSGSSDGSGIEDTADRQVTFCKRCNGLLKKAYELSMLYDAEVALIVFSSRGRLYEYNNSVEETIERYKKANSDTSNASTVAEINAQHYQQEAAKLKQHITYLQNSNRFIISLSCLDFFFQLDKVVHLVIGLEKIRARKNELLCAEIEYMQRRETELQNDNMYSKSEVAESERGLQTVNMIGSASTSEYVQNMIHYDPRNFQQFNIMQQLASESLGTL
uniref:MADS-box domain-containing protein n=1 Tax=Oryza barthii TaxID=65489 RepID=A0A0D3G4B3_9ORYZ